MTRWSIHVLAWVVITLLACLSAASAFGAAPVAASEAQTAHYMESARATPGLLLVFLREMPKGADLHNHLSGAIYAESFIQWAAENDQCVDPKTLVLVAPPCKSSGNLVPASNAFGDPILYRNMVDAYSMRNWKLSGQSGHDHFFDTFPKFDPIAHISTGKMLAETATRAASQHVPYQELMLTVSGDAFREMVQKTEWTDDLVEIQRRLNENGMKAAVAESQKLADAAESQKNAILRCGTPTADPGCAVQQKYLFQVLRGLPKNVVFAQIMLGFELANSDPRFVGLNLVMPEDYYVPMRDFPLHMRMLQYLHSVYPKVHISLHAGELATGMVPPEGLQFHIRDSVEVAHAERIGHGVDIMSETNPEQLMQEMAERGVMVEICLTSNETILGIQGKQHSLRQYMRNGVPVALATDDEGVSRSDMTLEYLKGVQEQDLTYQDLKKMGRTSLEHGFLPGASLWSNSKSFMRVRQCALDRPGAEPPSAKCQKFLDESPKAQLQWKLESDYLAFEARGWKPVSASSKSAAQSPPATTH